VLLVLFGPFAKGTLCTLYWKPAVNSIESRRATAWRSNVWTPTVAQASVVADVVEHIRGPKLIAFKMRRREGYHRKVGHRQELTVVKIKEIKT